MGVVANAVNWAKSIAGNPIYGYDQANRWGPNYDCSSFIISAWEQAGVKVKTAGATYTGNMRSVFLKCGFKDITSQVNLNTGYGLIPGDVLLNDSSHTAMFVGGGIVHASINEKGTVVGGMSGDQTGKEICIRSYYNFPWNVVLRYPENSVPSGSYGGTATVTINPTPATPTSSTTNVKLTETVKLPLLYKGMRNGYVKSVQLLLIGRNYSCGGYGADGDFGSGTQSGVKNFQQSKGLAISGEVNEETWKKLLEGS